MEELDWDTLLLVVDYDPFVGCLRNKKGKRLGWIEKQSSYRRVSIRGRAYQEHRVIFFLHHRRWPAPECDHKDLDRGNNKIENLREASFSENRHNKIKKPSRKRPNGKFEARISVGGGQKYLGVFNTVEEADRAYLRAAREHYGDFARGVR